MINRALPGAFVKDLEKDKHHHTLKLDDFKYINYEMFESKADYVNNKHVRSQSFSNDVFDK